MMNEAEQKRMWIDLKQRKHAIRRGDERTAKRHLHQFCNKYYDDPDDCSLICAAATSRIIHIYTLEPNEQTPLINYLRKVIYDLRHPEQPVHLRQAEITLTNEDDD